MIVSLLVLMLQVAPPVIDPILEPRRGEEAAPPPPSSAPVRLANCARLAQSDGRAAVAEGARWLIDNGGVSAQQCLGIGYAASGQWNEAVEAFDTALAGLAADDARRPAIIAQAANAALAGGDAENAKSRLDTLIAMPALGQNARGEALLDRARAHVALGDGPAAQADLTQAQSLLPNDPSVWLFSATLARRQGALDAAGDFIDRALELDEDDPAILLEAGNIAVQLNAYGVAREAWVRAAAFAPESEAGRAAARNVDRLDAIAGEGEVTGGEGG